MQVIRWLDEKGPTRTYQAGEVHIEHVQRALIEGLAETSFFGLSVDRARYYGNLELFGIKVVAAFPSAQNEIAESLKCIAFEVNSAAVFHLMRVAEIGLRALARDRKVALPKNAPLELGTWEQIIDRLEDSEEKIHNYPKTIAREQQYAFYHGALMEIRRFKNVWRNNIMHARDEYDRNQALSVFTHVKEFMNVLATRISETSEPLPEQWGDSEVIL
jgi:hypothetical protein